MLKAVVFVVVLVDRPLLTSAVGAVFGSCNSSRVVRCTGLAFCFPFLVLIKSNVAIVADVAVVFTVSSRRAIY